jgi:hypothetical protein
MTTNNVGLDLLVRRTPLDDGEWTTLIEVLCARIKPYLDSVTLFELGKVVILGSEPTVWHPLNNDNPEVSGTAGSLGLNTQGAFFRSTQEKEVRTASCDKTVHIWGIGRSGLWILADVDIKINGSIGESYEQASMVRISHKPIDELVQAAEISFELVWEALVGTLVEWKQALESRLDQIQRLYAEVQVYQLMLSRIPAK